MLSLLGFLVEIERRKIHLRLGYSSIFRYCVRALGHSEAEAMLRITVARCLMTFPEIYPLLESREVNLSTISRVSKVLDRENVTVVLERIRGKSMREVEAIAAEYDPATTIPNERVKTVVVRVPVSQAAAVKTRARPERAESHLCNSGKLSSTAEPNDNSTDEPTVGSAPLLQLERRSVLTIPADDEFMAMLGQIKDLASHQLRAGMTMQDVLKIAMRYYIDQKDPRARATRREARAETRAQTPARAASTNQRQIAGSVRDQVFVRDKRCTYVGPDGERCNSTHVLQVDHIQPVARGGAAAIENLRLLCAAHNRLESERLMGKRDVIRESSARYRIPPARPRPLRHRQAFSPWGERSGNAAAPAVGRSLNSC